MKTYYIPPKYRVVLYFFITIASVLALAYVYFIKPAPVRSVAGSTADTADTQMEKASSAILFIDSFAENFEYAESARSETGRNLFPEGADDVKQPEFVTTSEFDVANAGIIVTQSSNKKELYFNGVRIGRGEKLPNGLKVKDYGQVYVVLEDGSGATRRIDLSDRFVVDLRSRQPEVKK